MKIAIIITLFFFSCDMTGMFQETKSIVIGNTINGIVAAGSNEDCSMIAIGVRSRVNPTVTVGMDKEKSHISLVNMNSGKAQLLFLSETVPTGFEFSSNNSYLLCNRGYINSILWDIQLQQKHGIPPYLNGFSSTFSSNNTKILGLSNQLKIYDISTQQGTETIDIEKFLQYQTCASVCNKVSWNF